MRRSQRPSAPQSLRAIRVGRASRPSLRLPERARCPFHPKWGTGVSPVPAASGTGKMPVPPEEVLRLNEALRRALILPVVLVLIGLLALTMAGFVYFIRAEVTGTRAFADGQQARLAAESGLEQVIALMRNERLNFKAWSDNTAALRHGLVWSERFKIEEDPIRERKGARAEYLAESKSLAPAWRFSVVAEGVSGVPDTMRYGVTPESGKLNINVARDEQIAMLLTPLLLNLQLENPQELINALLDWRDDNADVRDGGAESEYYNTLKPPYNAKNGPFDTVEELLLVKGYTAAVLWGEDINRNGILDPNENDGDASEPLHDNGDGVLNRGIAPYLTIWSREPDTAADNKQRINLNADAGVIAAMIAQQIPDGQLSQATVAYIMQQKQSGVNFQQLGSPAALYTFGAATAPGSDQNPGGGAAADDDAKADANRQSRDPQPRPGATGARPGSRTPGAQPGAKPPDGQPDDKPPDDQPPGLPPVAVPGGAAPDAEPSAAPNPDADPEGQGGRRRGGGAPTQLTNSPATLEEMSVIMDRFSCLNPQVAQNGVYGLININSAPLEVLAVIPGMTPEAAAGIIGGRAALDPLVMNNTAWPLTQGLVDPATFRAIAPYITTKAVQVHVEAVGYADHVKTTRRMEWIIEMIGPVAQIKYQRDLTSLGMAWPIDDDSALVTTSR
ncbi:General secretion pathway protein K [Phycisphaerae bacterium RAS1]|nr:General secretion pathway protein K [Phycisphaerae bacterium RAS1]